MLNIAICDNEKKSCIKLEEITESYFRQRKLRFSIDVFHSSKSFIKYINKGNSFDVIFLAVEMADVSGIELGLVLRENLNDEMVKIIYISWYDSYAMQLFKIRPFDFVIKPIHEYKILSILDAVVKQVENGYEYLVYRAQSKCRIVPLKDIMYIQSNNRIITLFALNGEIKFNGKLDNVERKIKSTNFWRIHKSCIVNYMYAKKIEYVKIIMDDGKELSISQKYRVMIRDEQRKLLCM